MKLGLDIHGVLDSNPELFIHIAMQYEEVHIITGGSFTNDKYDLVGDLYRFAGKDNDFKWWTSQGFLRRSPRRRAAAS